MIMCITSKLSAILLNFVSEFSYFSTVPGFCSLNQVSKTMDKTVKKKIDKQKMLFQNPFSGGAIRALMMGIHAYFNIWCEARAGWAVFMKRRTAVHKISSLPEASPEQLQQFDDVCAICYQVI